MVKSILLILIETVFVCTLCEMIIPDGSLKKYFRLVIGFIIICTLLKPLANLKNVNIDEIKIDVGMTEEEMRHESEAYILRLHKENIEKRIKEIIGGDTEVFLRIGSDGSVLSITLKGAVSQDKMLLIKSETGCDDIKIVGYDENEN